MWPTTFSENKSKRAISTPSPIAKLYPETTVMFADIKGFTAWSASREPAQVFHLLEKIYGRFDSVAKTLSVFKVETIGDTYVAVVGLPTSRKHHAVVMAKFAKRCIIAMNEITKELEDVLGSVRLYIFVACLTVKSFEYMLTFNGIQLNRELPILSFALDSILVPLQLEYCAERKHDSSSLGMYVFVFELYWLLEATNIFDFVFTTHKRLSIRLHVWKAMEKVTRSKSVMRRPIVSGKLEKGAC
jgi:Adenylate and Guanylate cyclase catalytic domain